MLVRSPELGGALHRNPARGAAVAMAVVCVCRSIVSSASACLNWAFSSGQRALPTPLLVEVRAGLAQFLMQGRIIRLCLMSGVDFSAPITDGGERGWIEGWIRKQRVWQRVKSAFNSIAAYKHAAGRPEVRVAFQFPKSLWGRGNRWRRAESLWRVAACCAASINSDT